LASHLENFEFNGENYLSHITNFVKNLSINETGVVQVLLPAFRFLIAPWLAGR
jgi:hypothetical protein